MPAFHQGYETSITKIRDSFASHEDMNYNLDLMIKNNITKGCLYRSSELALCKEWMSYFFI